MVNAVAWSRDGTRVATGFGDGTARVSRRISIDVLLADALRLVPWDLTPEQKREYFID